MSNLRGKYAIVGAGETPVGKLGGKSTLALHQWAIKNALEDAGLTNKDVDGLLTNQPTDDPRRSYAVDVSHAVGIMPTYLTDLALGGATPIAMVQHAAMAIEAGLAHTVVCVHARVRASKALIPERVEVRDGEEDFEEPYGLIGAVATHAFAASRHMYEYGTTSEQMGAIAIATRKHACLNANATMRKPITLEDHQNSRWIVEPLHLLDCSLQSDGVDGFLTPHLRGQRPNCNRNAPDPKQRPQSRIH
jgi:acetyl-CoA acetyltransferase